MFALAPHLPSATCLQRACIQQQYSLRAAHALHPGHAAAHKGGLATPQGPLETTSSSVQQCAHKQRQPRSPLSPLCAYGSAAASGDGGSQDSSAASQVSGFS